MMELYVFASAFYAASASMEKRVIVFVIGTMKIEDENKRMKVEIKIERCRMEFISNFCLLICLMIFFLT